MDAYKRANHQINVNKLIVSIVFHSLGEQEMLWEHEPQASVSTTFFELFQTFTSVSITQ